MSSNSVGRTLRRASRIPSDSSWKTPIESPRASISKVVGSSVGIDSISISSPRERRMISIASSITSRLRSPRKSIFSSPMSSIGPIEYWVTILYWRSGLPDPFPFAARRPAAILGELQRDDLVQGSVGDHHRGRVDRVVADDPLQALGDVDDPATSARPRRRPGAGPGRGFRHSSKLGLRPMIGSGISFAARSPVP